MSDRTDFNSYTLTGIVILLILLLMYTYQLDINALDQIKECNCEDYIELRKKITQLSSKEKVTVIKSLEDNVFNTRVNSDGRLDLDPVLFKAYIQCLMDEHALEKSTFRKSLGSIKDGALAAVITWILHGSANSTIIVGLTATLISSIKTTVSDLIDINAHVYHI
jgi:hypothetical protein